MPKPSASPEYRPGMHATNGPYHIEAALLVQIDERCEKAGSAGPTAPGTCRIRSHGICLLRCLLRSNVLGTGLFGEWARVLGSSTFPFPG